jgi:hypothetical protein
MGGWVIFHLHYSVSPPPLPSFQIGCSHADARRLLDIVYRIWVRVRSSPNYSESWSSICGLWVVAGGGEWCSVRCVRKLSRVADVSPAGRVLPVCCRLLENNNGRHYCSRWGQQWSVDGHSQDSDVSWNVRVNPLTPELNPSAQRCLTRFFTTDFAFWTVPFVNICVKTNKYTYWIF